MKYMSALSCSVKYMSLRRHVSSRALVKGVIFPHHMGITRALFIWTHHDWSVWSITFSTSYYHVSEPVRHLMIDQSGTGSAVYLFFIDFMGVLCRLFHIISFILGYLLFIWLYFYFPRMAMRSTNIWIILITYNVSLFSFKLPLYTAIYPLLLLMLIASAVFNLSFKKIA